MKVRLDKFLSEKFPKFARSKIKRIIECGNVFVNSKFTSKPSYLVKVDDIVRIKKFLKPENDFRPEPFKFHILYEDKACLVIDKPAGVVVHPSGQGAHMTGTIANAVLDKISANFDQKLRPGIVHRLDKDTSGLLILAKTKHAYNNLIKQFKTKQVKKIYIALVLGKLKHSDAIIEAAIGRNPMNRKKMAVLSDKTGKKAISKYKVSQMYRFRGNFYSLLEIEIKSGRTHQIRVHLSAIGHHIIGDNLYGSKKCNKIFCDYFSLPRQFLHAWKLIFKSPDSKKIISLKCDLPYDLKGVIKKIEDFKIQSG